MEKKKSNLGGYRKGAGRKPIHPEGRMQGYLIEDMPAQMKKVDRAAKKLGISRAAFIRQAMRDAVDNS